MTYLIADGTMLLRLLVMMMTVANIVTEYCLDIICGRIICGISKSVSMMRIYKRILSKFMVIK